MACCVVALAMIYRLIDTWCRCRDWFAHVPLRPQRLARAPALRIAVLLVACVEVGAVGGLVYLHRGHLEDWGARALFTTAGLASNLCRSLPVSLEEP